MNSNGDLAEHLAEIFQPDSELIPGRIVNRLGKTMIPRHVFDPQVFVGDYIVGCDDASCQLNGTVFTLPTYFEMALRIVD